MDDQISTRLLGTIFGLSLGFIVGIIAAFFSERGMSFPPDAQNLKIMFTYTASFAFLCFLFPKYIGIVFDQVEAIAIVVSRLFLR